jgi:ABC-type multidrug transport system fused ATPase/permease subunit
MIAVLLATTRFMTRSERIRFFSLVALRALNGVFDLIGVLVIGYMAASVAAFLSSENNSNANKSIIFSGISLPALTAQTLPLLGAGIILTFSFKAIFAVYLTRRLAKELAIVEARSAKQILESVFSGGLDSSNLHSKEEIYYSIQTGSSAAFNGVLNSVATLISEGFLFVILFASFIALSPWATLGLFIFLALIAAAIQFFVGSHLVRTSKELLRHNIAAMSSLDDLYTAFREVSVLGKTSVFIERVYSARLGGSSSLATQTYLLGMPRYIIETSLILGIFVFGYIQSLSGDIAGSVSVIGVFLTGGFRILAAMLPFQAAFASIKSLVSPAKSALQFLSLPIQTGEAHDSNIYTAREPLGVVVTDLGFNFGSGSAETIKGISFRIEPGQQVAIVGPSGAGKSTIVDLILGLRAPSRGSVQFGSRSANELLKSFPGSIAYVPQRTGIVSGTVLENIALGIPKDDVQFDQVTESLQMAHLTEVIAALPDGVNSDLGKHADSLSGGQLQRLGLARAFYSKPILIVMDEATSGLDAVAEAEIGKALSSLRGTVTVLLVAHRLNTVKNADQVLVIEDGLLVSQGTFAEVLKSNPGIANAAKLVSLDG